MARFDCQRRFIALIDHQIGSTRLASIDYQYDANGNRTGETVYNRSLAMDVSQKTYNYNARHQLISVTDSLNSSNNATWAYDAAGNQTQYISNGVTTTYQYNLRQRMSAVIRDGLTIQTARYDHNGLRIEAQSTTGTQRYSYATRCWKPGIVWKRNGSESRWRCTKRTGPSSVNQGAQAPILSLSTQSVPIRADTPNPSLRRPWPRKPTPEGSLVVVMAIRMVL